MADQPRMTTENVLYGCAFLLDWLRGSKAKEQIRPLPREDSRAITRQIRIVAAQYRDVRGHLSELAQATETLRTLLDQHLSGHAREVPGVSADVEEEEDEDDDG
jgi:hypothetical protein